MILYYNVYIISDSYRLKNTITHSTSLPPFIPPPPSFMAAMLVVKNKYVTLCWEINSFSCKFFEKKLLFCLQVWSPSYLVPN